MTHKLLAIVCLGLAPVAGAGLVAAATALHDEVAARIARVDLEDAGTLWWCWCSPDSVSIRLPAVDRAAGPVGGGAGWAGAVGALEVGLELEALPAYAYGDLVVGDGLFWLPMPAPGGPRSAADDEGIGSGPGVRASAWK